MNRISSILLGAICGVCVPVSPAFAASPTTAPSSTTQPAEKSETTVASMNEAARRTHECGQIVSQQPLPEEKILTNQLRPALRKLEAQMREASRPISRRTGPREACELEMMAEIFHFGAGVTRIRQADPACADRIANLVKTEAPTLFAVARNLMWQTIEDQAALKRTSAVAIMQTLRSQIELFKLQHHDLAPDLSEGWSQFTRHTDDFGKVDDRSPFGPYVQSEPINPLTGGSKTKVVESRPNMQLAREGYKGFDYVFDRSGARFYLVDADGRLFSER